MLPLLCGFVFLRLHYSRNYRKHYLLQFYLRKGSSSSSPLVVVVVVLVIASAAAVAGDASQFNVAHALIIIELLPLFTYGAISTVVEYRLVYAQCVGD